ncbi:MAG: PspC protein [Aeromicrobium sp.]|jgi:phage shock protein C|nr:PspC protein [Aeromicrobium sp.]
MTKQLTRSREDKWLGGVCGGLADYTGIDATLIRGVTAVCILLGAGSLFVGYVVAWVLIPLAPRRPVPPTDSPTTSPAPPPPSA